MTLKDRYFEIKKTIPENVNLLCVSKNREAKLIEELYHLGQRDFGENKVQELNEKSLELSHFADIRWHFIGHLQTNKLNKLLKVEHLQYIHSLDREDLINKLLDKKIENTLSTFIQVNTSLEDEKGGFDYRDQELISKMLTKLSNHEGICVRGLMTMGKIRSDNFTADARECFMRLAQLKTSLEQQHNMKLELSMGMSNDYMIALEVGTNWPRIGSKFFI